MARIDGAQDLLIESLVARLREALGLSDSQVYQTWEPLSPQFPAGGDFSVSVAIGDGSFDLDLWEGGGRHQTCEQATVIVTGYSRVKLDRPDHWQKILRDESRGLLVVKKKILDVCCGYDLLDSSGNSLLRNPLYPLHAYRPTYDKQASIGRVSIEFATDFDWELTDPAP